jgi:hypothetical protein
VLLLLAFCLATIPAIAQTDLYDNGPTNGTVDAWTINFGFDVHDSFTLASNSTVNGLNFAAWLSPGDVLESAEVSITQYALGGTTYFDQQVNFTQTGCVLNQYEYNVCNESGSFPGVAMNAGSYWLTLQNAVVNTGNPVYWDENNGPSQAINGSEGTIPSESFTILGGTATSTTSTGTTPEPSSVMAFGSGILGAIGFARRKFFR